MSDTNLDNQSMLDALKILARVDLPSQLTSEERDQFYWSSPWRKIKPIILQRDNQECQVCKDSGGVTLTKLIVHHIKPLEYYPDLGLDEDNLLTVCHSCHNSIHFDTKDDGFVDWW